MSVHAGDILHVGGNNVIDRIQSAGLNDVRVPTEVIRETGNPQVVDKVPQDPDFTFNLESLDVTTEIEAWLSGKVGAGAGSAQAPGATDADGTAYDMALCGFVNIPSPWKQHKSGSAGVVDGGHLVPGYYLRTATYNFGVSENAQETFELAGGSYYYADGAPQEQFETGDGTTAAFPTDDPAIPYRNGGAQGTTFRSIFGVIVDGELQTEGVDYTQSPTNTKAPGTATLTFTTAPGTGADIRFCYFTTAAKSYPKSVHASTVTKPAAVRGRNICVFLGSGGSRAKVGSVQQFQLTFTVDGTVEREFCNEEIVGLTVNGTDCNGTLTVRAKNKAAFLALISKVTGVAADEVIGWLNQNAIPLEVAIMNPKNPAQTLKTLYVDDAIFQVPGTPVRVNQPTDFAMSYESRSGTYKVFKGAKA